MLIDFDNSLAKPIDYSSIDDLKNDFFLLLLSFYFFFSSFMFVVVVVVTCACSGRIVN